MALEKKDLEQIRKIVREEVDSTESKLAKKIDLTKTEILKVLGKEVSDLADINRAVINRTDELDYRLRIVERKLGLGTRR